MSYSQNAIEARVAELVAPEAATAAPAKSCVLVISRTPSIGQTMASEMANDPDVEGESILAPMWLNTLTWMDDHHPFIG